MVDLPPKIPVQIKASDIEKAVNAFCTTKFTQGIPKPLAEPLVNKASQMARNESTPLPELLNIMNFINSIAQPSNIKSMCRSAQNIGYPEFQDVFQILPKWQAAMMPFYQHLPSEPYTEPQIENAREMLPQGRRILSGLTEFEEICRRNLYRASGYAEMKGHPLDSMENDLLARIQEMNVNIRILNTVRKKYEDKVMTPLMGRSR